MSTTPPSYPPSLTTQEKLSTELSPSEQVEVLRQLRQNLRVIADVEADLTRLMERQMDALLNFKNGVTKWKQFLHKKMLVHGFEQKLEQIEQEELGNAKRTSLLDLSDQQMPQVTSTGRRTQPPSYPYNTLK